MTSQPSSALLAGLRSPGVKFFVVGLIGFLLLIPASMVWLLVAERQDRANGAVSDVAQSWGGQQIFGGMFITVPFETRQETQTAKGTVVQQSSQDSGVSARRDQIQRQFQIRRAQARHFHSTGL
jgi:inner membrane protein